MAEYTIRMIPIKEAKVGMVLADTVMSEKGPVLLTQDMVLNAKNIQSLQIYGIEYIYIKQPIHTEYIKCAPTPPLRPSLSSVSNTEAFQKFEGQYENTMDMVKDKILYISDGNPINITDLFSMSNDIIGTLHSKSSLMTFLYNLKDTDDYTYTHCVNVSLLCNIFGQWLGYKGEKLQDLTVAGLLHDIGKTKISTTIINKPGKLTTEEFDEIKRHTVYGYEMIENQDIGEDIKKAILMHHEKLDGSGYPTHSHEEQINDMAKIVSITDIYDAMTAARSYHKKTCPFKVMQCLEQESYGKLDLKLLRIFLKNISQSFVGKKVRLSSGQEGEIVFVDHNHCTRPIVKVGDEWMDLKEHTELYIDEII